MKSTDHAATLLLSIILVSCGGSDKPKPTEAITSVNIAPTVEIENKAIAFENMEVQLVANAQDDDGNIVNYVWKQTKGTPVELSSNNTFNTHFTVPAIEADEEFNFNVTVTDNDGATTNSTTILTVVPRKEPIIKVTINGNKEENDSLITLEVQGDVRGIENYQIVFDDERVKVEQQTDNTFIAKIPDVEYSQNLKFNTTVTTINNLVNNQWHTINVINDDFYLGFSETNAVRPQDTYRLTLKQDDNYTGPQVNNIAITQTAGPQVNITNAYDIYNDKYLENTYQFTIPAEIITKQNIELLATVLFEDNNTRTYTKTITILESKYFEYHTIDTETAEQAISHADPVNPDITVDWSKIKFTPSTNGNCGVKENGSIGKPSYFYLVDINQDGLNDLYFMKFIGSVYGNCEGMVLAQKEGEFTGLSHIRFSNTEWVGAIAPIFFYDINNDGYLEAITYAAYFDYGEYTTQYAETLMENINGIPTIKKQNNQSLLTHYNYTRDVLRGNSVSGHFIDTNTLSIIHLSQGPDIGQDFLSYLVSDIKPENKWLTISHLVNGKISEETVLFLADDMPSNVHKGDINNDGILEVILSYWNKHNDGNYSYRYISLLTK